MRSKVHDIGGARRKEGHQSFQEKRSSNVAALEESVGGKGVEGTSKRESGNVRASESPSETKRVDAPKESEIHGIGVARVEVISDTKHGNTRAYHGCQ